MKKIDYMLIKADYSDFVWSYSAKELEDILSEMFCGKKLKKIFANYNGFTEGNKIDGTLYNFTYLGGSVIMLFEGGNALELDIYGEGMVRYRTHRLSDMSFTPRKDFPYYIQRDECYCDMKDVFDIDYENRVVEKIAVDAINYYIFYAGNGFDSAKADAAASLGILPNIIDFHLSGESTLSLIGDNLNNYYMKLE